eukprot:SAG31_NODE_39757_length_285_cov_2.698925_1_plen_45_part_01
MAPGYRYQQLMSTRLRHLEDMRTATFDRIQEAENNYSQYYNKKRV